LSKIFPHPAFLPKHSRQKCFNILVKIPEIFKKIMVCKL
jgi:hypothetical protein